MKHFINLKDISASDLRKIILDAKIRKIKRKNKHPIESVHAEFIKSLAQLQPVDSQVLARCGQKPADKVQRDANGEHGEPVSPRAMLFLRHRELREGAFPVQDPVLRSRQGPSTCEYGE